MSKVILAIILFTILNISLLKADKTSYTLVKNLSNISVKNKDSSLYNLSSLDSYKVNFKKNFFAKTYGYTYIPKLKELVDLMEFDIYKKYGKEKISIEPIEFRNEGTNLNFIINVEKVCFKGLTFNIMDKSVLNINFLLKNDMEVTGKPILIEGNSEDRNVIISMRNVNKKYHKYKLDLYAINSKLPTQLEIENIELSITKEIAFRHDKNQVIINNGIIHGNINLHGIKNEVKVNNTQFKNCEFNFRNENNQFILENVMSENSKFIFKNKDNFLKFKNVTFGDNSNVVLESINNTIEIYSYFQGNIESLNNGLTLLFKDTEVKNSIITLNNNNILKFDNTLKRDNPTVSNINITFNGDNIITFNNTMSIDSHLNFRNKGINVIRFAENGSNQLGGEINIDSNSVVNLEFESNSKTVLDISANGIFNEFNIKSGGELILLNKETININKFIYKGSNTIGIDLNNTEKFYLSFKEYQFDKDSKVNLRIYNISKLLSGDSNEVVYKFLKCEADLDKSLNINLNNSLCDYTIEIKNNEILLILKKNESKTFRELVKKYYIPDQYIFYEKDFLSLAGYLDILSKVRDNEKIDPILDYIGRMEFPNDSNKFFNFLSNILPISNNILYRASYDTTLSFLEDLNSISNKDRIFEPSIWSNTYHIDNNFTLGNSRTTNIKLIGNGLGAGIVYPVNNYVDIGSSIGCSYSNTSNYTYNINLFSVNLATLAKLFIANNLCNLSIINFNLQNFDIHRNVIMDGYDSINSSSPLVKSLFFHNAFSYSLDVIDNRNINFNVKPNLKFTLGKVVLSDYSENGKESWYVNGFNTFTSTTELSIYSSIGIKLEKANLKTICSLGTGYEINDLSATKFKFTEDKSNNSANLADYYNKYSYLKLDIGLIYSPSNLLYDASLLFSYKSSKIANNLKIGVALSFKF